MLVFDTSALRCRIARLKTRRLSANGHLEASTRSFGESTAAVWLYKHRRVGMRWIGRRQIMQYRIQTGL